VFLALLLIEYEAFNFAIVKQLYIRLLFLKVVRESLAEHSCVSRVALLNEGHIVFQ
jgi:hypothetical protein